MPAFGGPKIVTGIPFLIAFPVLKDSIKQLNSLLISNNRFLSLFLSANSTSSSAKSNSNSINEAKSINRTLKFFNLFEKPPFNC